MKGIRGSRYTASFIKNMTKHKFSISGMHCAACSASIEKALNKLPGIKEAKVNLLSETLSVIYDDNLTDCEKIADTVNSLGFICSDYDFNSAKKQSEKVVKQLDGMKKRLYSSFVFFILIMYISMGHMVSLPLPKIISPHHSLLNFALIQLIITIPVLIINRAYFISGLKSLKNGSPNMDTLITTGSLSSLLYGIYLIIMIIANKSSPQTAHDFYFESAVTILTLITLGKYLEAKSKRKTTSAIEALMDMTPKTALLYNDGKITEINANKLKKGDIILVKPGMSIPADGIITEGETSVDESSLTGESMPVSKSIGNEVTTATINLSGSFTFRVTAAGFDTVFSQIIELVEEASNSKAPVSRLADKISSFFVPAVMLISLLSFIFWMFFQNDFNLAFSMGISVLVISCPCALGLATPVAIMVGTGRGAQSGIMIKSAQFLEISHKIKTVVFDKTGTITTGKIKVTEIITNGKISENDFIKLSASLEALSEHPLGKAVVKKADGIELIKCENFKATFGKGVTGTLNGEAYIGGNEKFLNENGYDTSLFAEKSIELKKNGATVLYFGHKNETIGIIAVSDTIRETSRQAIKELNDMGIKTVMLTGDNIKTAEYIGKQVGISQIIADVLPKEKEEKIRSLMNDTNIVAMVGDGVNDAPALSRADVGIAIGGGSQIASNAADVVLMKDNISDVKGLIKLSEKVMKNIKMNLFWAFFYNILGIPVAAGIFYIPFGLKLNPMIAAAAMSLSSVCVVTNALRLRKAD